MSDAKREALIIERRTDNVPFRKIADEINLSVSRVHQIFNEACARVPSAVIHTLRVQSSELADRAINNLLVIAEDKKVHPRTRTETWTTIRGWSESLRKLHGVDAPTRREVTVVTEDVVDAALRKASEDHDALARQLEALDSRAVAGLVALGEVPV
jgi:hypothetical protein